MGIHNEQSEERDQAIRNAIMEVLNLLYPGFKVIGALSQAGPLLDRLMAIAYGQLPERITESSEYRRMVGNSSANEDDGGPPTLSARPRHNGIGETVSAQGLNAS